jgi:cell division protein FtsL
MAKKVKLLLTILSVAVLLLVLLNILLALGTQSVQVEVNERQQVIAQTMQLDTLNRQVITVLANLAMKSNDNQLKKLLASSGVNLGLTDEPGAAPK